MTVLVTGARYIGSHMVHALVDAGQQVVVPDNIITVPPRAPLAIGDAKINRRVAPVIATHRVDAILHFAVAASAPGAGAATH